MAAAAGKVFAATCKEPGFLDTLATHESPPDPSALERYLRHFPALPRFDEEMGDLGSELGSELFGDDPGAAAAAAGDDDGGAPPPRAPRAVTGEASAGLLLHGDPRLIAAALPAATRFIVALRDPLEARR